MHHYFYIIDVDMEYARKSGNTYMDIGYMLIEMDSQIFGKNCSYDLHYRYLGGVAHNPSKQAIIATLDYTKLIIILVRSKPYITESCSNMGCEGYIDYGLLVKEPGVYRRLRGYDVDDLDLYHQPPANDRQRFVFLVTPFGVLTDVKNWEFFYFYYMGRLVPMHHKDYPYDLLSGLAASGSYIVYTFDVGKSVTWRNLVLVGEYWSPMNFTDPGSGYVFTDYIYKLIRILADEGYEYQFGYYPSIETAHNYIMSSGAGSDGVEFAPIISASGPFFYGRIDVPIFLNT